MAACPCGGSGLTGRKAISWSAHCVSLLLIDCFRVSLTESREWSHWINPRTHQVNEFKCTNFLVFQTSEIYHKPVLWLLLHVEFFFNLSHIFQIVMSGPMYTYKLTTPLSVGAYAQSAAVTLILLGDKKGAIQVFGCHCCWLTLVSVTNLLGFSCVGVVKLPLCWRGQCPACLTVTLPFSWGTNSYLLIYFHYYDSTKGNRDTQAIRSISGWLRVKSGCICPSTEM